MGNKRINYLYGLLVILLLLLFGANSNSEVSAQTLKYTDHEPLGGMRTRFINDILFPAIEKESNGRLKIEAHWGGELSTGYDALQAVGKGTVADMAIVVPEYVSKDLPLHQIFKSFPVGPTGDKQVEFFRRVYAEIPAFPAELEKGNVVNVFFAIGFPVAFLSTSQLNTLEDIGKGKWRSASFWHQSFLQNAGATPVTMPWGEGVRKALQDGTLSGLMVNIDSGDDIKAHKVAPNVLVSPDLWLGHIYLFVMNKDTWNSLSKENKEAVERAVTIAYKSLGNVMKDSFETLVDDFKKDSVNIRLLDSVELEQWKVTTRFEEVQTAWVKEQEDKGVKDVCVTMEKVNTIMNDIMK